MDLGKITSGAAFKTALRGTLAFLLVLAVSGAVAFYYLHREMVRSLQEQIVQDQILLTQIYRDSGEQGLIDAINSLRRPLGTHPASVALFDRAGRRIAGDISLAPDFVGWSRQSVSVSAPGAAAAEYYLHGARIDRMTLLVGRSMDHVEFQERRIVIAFLTMGAVVAAAFLAIGYATSFQTQRKLDRMLGTLDRVSQGELDARLPVAGGNDQVDRVSRLMNQHLDRLSDLMITTKTAAAAIAHDLRTPLSRVFLMVDRAMQNVERGADPRVNLEEAGAELTRLRGVFDAILRIARLESGQEQRPFEPVALGPILTEIAETFAPLAEDKGQDLTLETVPADAVVMGDGPMLAQMAANLVQNAITHCPPGTHIGLAAEAADGAVRLVVQDDGPGIPEAARKRVFDPFYRADANRTGAGNGLGLALVRAIAERMGAAIALQDARPGLRVEVTFPPAETGAGPTV